MPNLYVVATPIGNLEDITLRAIRLLREVELIAAEDTRRTKLLLATYEIKTPVTSYHEHNKWTKLDYILGHLEKGDVALVSSAGMPGISDPGYELITAAHRRGFLVVPVPGPSVVITALAISGLPTDRFLYLGFLPHKGADRRHRLEAVAKETSTMVMFEAPHRMRAALNDMLAVLGDREVAVCRELTKIHEEVFRGSISQAVARFTEPRGEFTIVIAGEREKGKPEVTEDIKGQLRDMRLSGVLAKEAVSRVAKETGLSKKEIYRTWISIS